MGRKHTWPETYAKEVLGTMLELRGTVMTEYEIELGKERRLRADLHFEPDPGRSGHSDLGAVDRIADLGQCIVELFSSPPRSRAGLDCMSKHHLWYRQLRNQARRAGQIAPPRPVLWMLSPGRPRSLIAGLDMKPMHDWPRGFWRLGDEFRAHLIAVRDVPVVPDTLPLRLLNNGERQLQAIGELHRLPEGSRLRQRVLPLVLAWLEKVSNDSTEVQMQRFSETKTEYDRWAERHRSEGMERGIERGTRALVRKQLALRFGKLPADAEKRLERASVAELELLAERLLTADSLAAVLAD